MGPDPDSGEVASGGGRAVRLLRCGHGGYHLAAGGVTVQLSEAELALLGRAIHVMAGRHPSLLRRLLDAALGDGGDGASGDGVQD